MENIDHAKETLKSRICKQIQENYDVHFEFWIDDAWHAGFPSIYVDVFFGTFDKDKTLKTRIGEVIVNELQRKVETMGEHISHATAAFIRVFPNHDKHTIVSFVKALIDRQFDDNELTMFWEPESEDN